MATTITKQQYEDLKTKAFYIKQNPGLFIDAILDAVGIEVADKESANISGSDVEEGANN